MNVLGRRRELARMSKPELIDRVIELEARVPDVGGVDARPDGWDEFDEQLMRAAVRGARDTDRENRCDYCGDALPSLVSREAGLPTPDLIRRGFDPHKIVCPECATDRENGSQS